MKFPGFIGGTSVERSLNVNAERTINLYPRYARPGVPKSPIALYSTPGLRVWCHLGTDTEKWINGLWSQDGRCFAVCGAGFYELFNDATTTLRGTVEDNGTPARFASNGPGGYQLAIVAGETLYCYDLKTNELERISGTAPVTTASMSPSSSPSASATASPTGSVGVEADDFPDRVMLVDYLDGYFVVLAGFWDAVPFATQLYISALNDGMTWDVGETAQVSSSSNKILSMIVDHREIWLFGYRTSEVWTNTGDKDFPFGPLQGVFMEFGCTAVWSLVRIDNTLMWLSSDERGEGKVYRMNGYVPQRVSTHAVEYWLAQAGGQINEAKAYTYDEEGHSFYVLQIPTPDATRDWTTWVYDVATGLWHERAVWNTDLSIWEPQRALWHTYTWTRHLVGDRATNVIYHQSLAFYDEELP
jgi:hypothetical protein